MKHLKFFGEPLTLSALAGLTIVTFYLIAMVFGPWLTPHDPTATTGPVWGPPAWGHWLGFDNLGRDMLSRLISSAQITVGSALAASLLCNLLGCTLAIVAALSPGWVDTVISRVVDVFLAVPMLIFALALLTVFKGTAALILTIGVLSAPRVYRLARAVAMEVATLDYVEAARMRGEGYGWIIVHEILPNALPPLLAEFGMRISYSLLFISSLSFLGFGVQPPLTDWGSMVRENALVISFGGMAALYPAAALALFAIGVNLIVDWVLSFGKRQGELVK